MSEAKTSLAYLKGLVHGLMGGREDLTDAIESAWSRVKEALDQQAAELVQPLTMDEATAEQERLELEAMGRRMELKHCRTAREVPFDPPKQVMDDSLPQCCSCGEKRLDILFGFRSVHGLKRFICNSCRNNLHG